MDANTIVSIIGVIVAIIAILATLFQKSFKVGIMNFVLTTRTLVRKLLGSITFRSLVFILAEALFILFLNTSKLAFPILYFDFYIILLTWLLGLFFIFGPLIRQIGQIQTDLNNLRTETNIIIRTRQLELENVKGRWSDFIKSLEAHSGFEIIAGYLSLSRPVYIENEIIVIGLPEVIVQTSQGIDLARVTPFVKEFFKNDYKLKLISYDQF